MTFPRPEDLQGNENAPKDDPKDVAVNVLDNLTERQRVICDFIRQNVAVNTKLLSEKLGVNRKTIQRELVALREAQHIRWVGSDKTGHWEIIE